MMLDKAKYGDVPPLSNMLFLIMHYCKNVCVCVCVCVCVFCMYIGPLFLSCTVYSLQCYRLIKNYV